jgi:L1 cell adhesion molecule like protein
MTVFEGKRRRTRDSNLLGTFDATRATSVPQIELVFCVNADGVLNVSAQDESTGNAKKITIKNERGRLSWADIERMVADAGKFEAQDGELRKKIESKSTFEGYCFGVPNSMHEEKRAALNPGDKEVIMKEINDTLAWINGNTEAKFQSSRPSRKNLK